MACLPLALAFFRPSSVSVANSAAILAFLLLDSQQLNFPVRPLMIYLLDFEIL